MKRKLLGTSILALTAFALFAALTPAALAADCTLRDAKGTWAYSLSGSVFNGQSSTPAPVVTAGLITFDGKGKAAGSETQVSPLGSMEVTYSGTYTEKTDCSGTFNLTNSKNEPLTGNFVCANNDNDCYLILTAPGYVMAGSTKRFKHR